METYALAQSAFFDRLLHVSGQASVLVGFVLGAQWLLKTRLTPAWRHGLWFLVLARLALPVLPESSWSIFNWKGSPFVPGRPLGTAVAASARGTQPAPSQRITLPPLEPSQTREGISVFQNATRPMDPSSAPIMTERVAPPVAIGTGLVTPNSLRIASRHTEKVQGASLAERLRTALPWCWLAGVLCFGFRVVCQNACFAKRLRGASPVPEPEILKLLADCSAAMRVKRLPLLLETKEVKTPALYGLIRPRLLLPEGMTATFSRQEMRFVFLHELGHVRRHDMAVHWLTVWVQMIHWFNPLLWFAFTRMRADREVACDALALSRAGAGASQPYGETIIRLLSELNSPISAPGLVGIMEEKQQIKHRLRMVARFQPQSSWSILALGLFAALAITTLTDAQTERNTELVKPTPPTSGATSAPSRPLQASDLKETRRPENASSVKLIQDARLLIEVGRLDNAEAKLEEVLRQEPGNRDAEYHLKLIQEARWAATRKRAADRTQTPPELKTDKLEIVESPAFRKTNELRTSPGRAAIQQKLRDIVLQDVRYEGIPLRDVVADLNQQARERDPEKRGVNFILNPGTVNLNDVLVRLELADVTLGQVVDAVSKVSEVPLKYAMEEYAVVFTHRAAEDSVLFTRTFKLDPTSFRDALQKLQQQGVITSSTHPSRSPQEAGVSSPAPAGDETPDSPRSSSSITAKSQNAGTMELVRVYFQAVGVDFSPNVVKTNSVGLPQPSGKALFYSDTTGLLLARATLQDLDLIEKAVQFLNITPPQISLDAMLVEIVAGKSHQLGFDWFLGNTQVAKANPPSSETSTDERPESERAPELVTNEVPVLGGIPVLGRLFRSDKPSTGKPNPVGTSGILTDPQFRVVRRALEENPDARTLGSPRVTTVSGRQIRVALPAVGLTLNVLPTVSGDDHSVRVEVDFSLEAVPDASEEAEPGGAGTNSQVRRSPRPEINATTHVSTHAIIWDGQTMAMGPFPAGQNISESPTGRADANERKIFLFLTPTIVDPAGNRVHTP